MKKIRILVTLTLVILSCQNPDKFITEEERLRINKYEQDSLLIVFDSLMQIKVNVPHLVDSNIVSIKCLEEFTSLAKATGGDLKIVANSRLVTKTIIEIINDNSTDYADLMILIDKTGSMEDDIKNIQIGLKQILNKIKQFKNIRLAVGTYGDKNVDGKSWYDFKNFEEDFEGAGDFINNLKTTGGGDLPESVYDGIYEAFKEDFWKSNSKRMVILIGDAPSLDSSLTSHHLDDIVTIAKRDKINMNFYPIVISPFQDETVLENITKMERMNFILNIYPNPTNGPITIDLNNTDELTIEIIDQKGNIVKSFYTKNTSEKMDLSELTPGLFIVRVYDKFKNFDDQKIVLMK